MYGWIFRHLPGPRWFKAIEAVMLIALVVWALFMWFYPWLNTLVNSDGTMSV